MDVLLSASPIKASQIAPSIADSSGLYLHQLQKQQYASHARTHLEHVSQLDIDRESVFVRHTTVVCTLGDIWNTDEKIAAMVKGGMNILRLNLSMGSYDYYRDAIKRMRAIEEESNYKPVVGIAVDISPPPLRTGLINHDVDGQVFLKDNHPLILTVDPEQKDCTSDSLIFVDCQYFPSFIECVVPGDHLHLDDGMMTLVVQAVHEKTIDCIVQQGGHLGSYKRIDLLTEKIYQRAFETSYTRDLAFAVETKVDYVFTGYTLSPQQLVHAKEVLGNNILLFAKVQTKEAVKNLDQIMAVSDGIIVGRSGLGLVYPIEKVFQLQKQIIAQCNIMHKPVFVISHLLESMRFKPRATRAEISDVANAVIDGADGLILTVETSRGLYPREALCVLHQTCREAESAIFHERFCKDLKASRECRGLSYLDPAYLSALAAVEASYTSSASAIFVVTTTGRSAAAIASFRPSCPVISIMRRPEVGRLSHAFRGLHPFVCIGEKLNEWSDDMDARLNAAMDYAKFRGFVSCGDQVVVVTGWRAGTGATNTVRVFELPRNNQPISIVGSHARLQNLDWND